MNTSVSFHAKAKEEDQVMFVMPKFDIENVKVNGLVTIFKLK